MQHKSRIQQTSTDYVLAMSIFTRDYTEHILAYGYLSLALRKYDGPKVNETRAS
jgi:hypothetical protein